MEKSAVNTTVVASVIALLVGGGIGYMLTNGMDDSESNNTMSSMQMDVERENISVNAPAADLRVSLNNALREHVSLAGVALRNIYTEAPDTEASVVALDANSVEVASLVGSVYGQEAEESFLDLWRQHITFFADYTVGAREGNQAEMDQALEDLEGYTVAAANFFADANPNLPVEATTPGLNMHKNQVIDIINTIGAGDFDMAYEKLGEATDHMNELGNALATAIEKQNPEQF